MIAPSIESRLADVQSSVHRVCERAGRSNPVTLVAVSKTVDLPRLQEAYAAGQRVFGENKVQEAAAKIQQWDGLPADVQWHMLGHLQTNKVTTALQLFQCLQTVDSLRLAEIVDKRAAAQNRRIPVLLEINVAAEPSKTGFQLDDLLPAVRRMNHLPSLDLRGLMTVAPAVDDPEDVRWVFRRLRELRDLLAEDLQSHSMVDLSMGMSADFPVAIEEGATMVRIGRAIFGERQPPPVAG